MYTSATSSSSHSSLQGNIDTVPASVDRLLFPRIDIAILEIHTLSELEISVTEPINAGR
jgi:hypothetical protein